MRIANIRRGDIFEFNGHTFLLIGKRQGICTLIDTEPVYLPFSTNNSIPSADFSQSYIASYLRNNYITEMLTGKDGDIFSDLLCTMTMSLSATNTSLGYGRYRTNVGILTLSQYIRNHDLLSSAGVIGWLATPVYPSVITRDKNLLSWVWKVDSDNIPKIARVNTLKDLVYPVITMKVDTKLENKKKGRFHS